MAWQYSVPTVAPGSAVNADSVNAPVTALAQRTAALKTLVDNLTSGERLLKTAAVVAADVEVGNVVYLSTTTFVYEKASAQYRSLVSTNGRLLPAEQSVYTGVVLSKEGTVATLLLLGIGTLDTAALTTLFGTASPAAGLYWLASPDAPGTVVDAEPNLAVTVLQYIGDGVVQVFPPVFDKLTHRHKSYLLDSDDWVAVTEFDSSIVPDGAAYGYDFSSSTAVAQLLSELLLPTQGQPSFVWDYSTPADDRAGRHVDATVIVLDSNGLWWMDATAPDMDILALSTMADARGIAYLHSATTATPEELTLTVTNGILQIAAPPWDSTADAAGGEVVKNISGRTMSKGYVIEDLSVGPGLTKGGTRTNPSLDLTEYHDLFIPAGIVNLNNAVTEAEGPLVLVKYPQSRLASVSVAASLPNMGTPSAYEALVVLYVYGTGSLVDGDDLVVTAEVLPTPAEAGVLTTVPAGFPTVMPNIPAGVQIYKLVCATAIDCATLNRGMVFYNVEIDSPTDDIRVLSFGIQMQLKS